MHYIFHLPSELELPPAQPPATHITASNFSDPRTESSSFKICDSLTSTILKIKKKYS